MVDRPLEMQVHAPGGKPAEQHGHGAALPRAVAREREGNHQREGEGHDQPGEQVGPRMQKDRILRQPDEQHAQRRAGRDDGDEPSRGAACSARLERGHHAIGDQQGRRRVDRALVARDREEDDQGEGSVDHDPAPQEVERGGRPLAAYAPPQNHECGEQEEARELLAPHLVARGFDLDPDLLVAASYWQTSPARRRTRRKSIFRTSSRMPCPRGSATPCAAAWSSTSA